MNTRAQPDVIVTDHAVLRWLERECNIPVEEIRQLIRAGCNPYRALAPVSIKIGRIKFIVVDGRVVSTVPRGSKIPARRRQKR